QLPGRHVLEQEAARADTQRLVDVLVQIKGRENEHAALDAAQQDAPGRLDPVHGRHTDVHQDDVREQPLRQLDRLAAVAGLADDLDVVLGAEDHAEAVAHERLVVAEENADDHRSVAANGSRAATRKPPSGTGSVSTLPPSAAARSRMPISP